eukprot:scaffold17363_cov145-Skeletonema_menzelii.AAC.5
MTTRKRTTLTTILLAAAQLAALMCTSSYAFILPSSHQPSSSSSKIIIHQPHSTKLQLSSQSASTIQSDVIERLELTEQFSRWKFLQQLLDNELAHSDIEDVLLLSLSAYLQHGPGPKSYNNKDENGGNASPVLNEEQRQIMSGVIEQIVAASDGIGDSRFLHLLVLPQVDYESLTIDVEDDGEDQDDEQKQLEEEVQLDQVAVSILTQIEQLLPDPIEDEESYKSAWDVVIDLYGRESVRVKEEKLQREKESGGRGTMMNLENLEWRTLCAVGRVLIHYDFLTKGVLREGVYSQ